MSTPRHSEDPELRALLDSLGIAETGSVPDVLSDTEYEKAERMLDGILSRRREPPTSSAVTPSETREPHSWLFGRRVLNFAGAAAVCLLVGLLVVIQPWSKAPHAAAQTPAMLRFADVREGQIKQFGDPAAAILRELAELAAAQPAPPDQPVQHVELDAWWATTAPSDQSAGARTVLVPTISRVYLLPNGDRRAIEYRGEPLDADGRLSETKPDWDDAPLTSDTITTLDPDQGFDYIQTLPTSTAGLREELAPDDGCADARGGCLLSSVTSLFESYVVPPEVASRLWETLATEPTITSLGVTTDRLGRDAIAFTAQSMSSHEQLLVLIDPETGNYLASETILVEPDENIGFDPPAVIGFTALITATRVAETDVPDDSTAQRY